MKGYRKMKRWIGKNVHQGRYMNPEIDGEIYTHGNLWNLEITWVLNPGISGSNGFVGLLGLLTNSILDLWFMMTLDHLFLLQRQLLMCL